MAREHELTPSPGSCFQSGAPRHTEDVSTVSENSPRQATDRVQAGRWRWRRMSKSPARLACTDKRGQIKLTKDGSVLLKEMVRSRSQDAKHG
jgi:hypothetical protein